MKIVWQVKAFSEFSLHELYQVLRLRNEVFVVEQQCPFQDLDNKDQDCHHLLAYLEEGTLAAYARLVPAGLTFEHAAIGRVVTSPSVRHLGLGRELMQRSIGAIEQLYGPVPIQIGAQLYLKRFYEAFGFRAASPMYLEDGIEHIEMIRQI
ncbi:GNAT family N-acetyltransferase [Rhabdobacter roseus]|uniref:ElaA protein n=1 Tax=Rhabdobacter roseus TaxID=1655419 RepID=A0A840TRU5_9BACT|nr:GNAT family N-acetyltransferase [Rhabdobacter roseus]MBB5282740.1 ElaA protein [Rhabdobacter roseus]